MADNAIASLRIFTPLLIITSVLWNKASNPWYAVYLAGTVRISSGSTMARTGVSSGAPKPIFSFVLGLEITPQQLISEPVPEVVAMVTMGKPGFFSGIALPVPPKT